VALEEATALREGVLRVALNLDRAKYVPRRHHGLAFVQVRTLWPTVCETIAFAFQARILSGTGPEHALQIA
jgi:hypothetical protein